MERRAISEGVQLKWKRISLHPFSQLLSAFRLVIGLAITQQSESKSTWMALRNFETIHETIPQVGTASIGHSSNVFQGSRNAVTIHLNILHHNGRLATESHQREAV